MFSLEFDTMMVGEEIGMNSTATARTYESQAIKEKVRTYKGHQDVLYYWEKISELHRHEDTLLNTRLQAFLISTAFLVATFRNLAAWN